MERARAGLPWFVVGTNAETGAVVAANMIQAVAVSFMVFLSLILLCLYDKKVACAVLFQTENETDGMLELYLCLLCCTKRMCYSIAIRPVASVETEKRFWLTDCSVKFSADVLLISKMEKMASCHGERHAKRRFTAAV